jgi:raffinose/stachyose/melibiose transport system permease protein
MNNVSRKLKAGGIRASWLGARKFDWDGLLFILPAVLLFLLFVAYPILQNIINSMFRFSALDPHKLWVGIHNYRELFKDEIFWTALKNNLVWTVLSVTFQIGFALSLAEIIERRINKGTKIFRTIFFLPMVMSVVAVGLVWLMIYDPVSGLLNMILSLFGFPMRGWLGVSSSATVCLIIAAIWQYTGFYMIIVIAGYQNIPKERFEAAIVDGASPIQTFFRITLPGLRSVLTVTILFSAIGSFKVFDYVWVMTQGGPAHASEVLTTLIYRRAFLTHQMGYSSTVSTILFGITLIFMLIRLWLNNLNNED